MTLPFAPEGEFRRRTKKDEATIGRAAAIIGMVMTRIESKPDVIHGDSLVAQVLTAALSGAPTSSTPGQLHTLSAPVFMQDLVRLLLGNAIDLSRFDAPEWHALSPELGAIVPVAPDAAPALPPDTKEQASPALPEPKPGANSFVINQLDARYQGQRLGLGGDSMQKAGCLLSTLAMAANRMSGSSYDLVSANQQVQSAGGYKGSSMLLDRAAASLGVTVRSRALATRNSMGSVEAAVERGELGFAGVDYKDGKSSAISEADHFLLIVGKGENTLQAIDPAGGREITFTQGLDGHYYAGKYRIAEVGVLGRNATQPQLRSLPVAA
jgi:hypothetical protein